MFVNGVHIFEANLNSNLQMISLFVHVICFVGTELRTKNTGVKQEQKKSARKIGVREARTLDLRITQRSYETYALANCATTP